MRTKLINDHRFFVVAQLFNLESIIIFYYCNLIEYSLVKFYAEGYFLRIIIEHFWCLAHLLKINQYIL